MSMRRIWVKALLLIGTLSIAAPARAGTTLAGPNTDFPDVDLVMPFAAAGARSTFFSITNIGEGIIRARWTFFDESGEIVDVVDRDLFGEGGTDIVDITSIRDRTIDANGQFIEGPARSLAGRRGFVIVYGDGQPRLLGNFTMANLETNSAFGVNASGFGAIGSLAQDQAIVGTTFNPLTLQDNLLTIIALNWPDLTSLTNGGPPPAQPVFTVRVILLGNDPENAVVAETVREVRGSALFVSLRELFPTEDLNGSASILAIANEGAGYSGSGADPDGDDGVGIIGYYGQAVGPFGAGQTLRSGVVL
jgi:hypothetical protein